MPSEQRGVPTPSHFHEDIRNTPEKKQFGFMKTNQMPEGHGDNGSNLPTSYLQSQHSSLSGVPPSTISNGRTTPSDTHYESSLFSSSLSELFSRKLQLPRSDKVAFTSANREEQPSESLEEMDAHTIGNFLPDEDDFFAEVTGEVGHKSRANGSDDMDDCDLFSSVGGMELDGEVFLSVGQRDGRRDNNFSVFGEHPRGETLSRVLFVGNIDSIIEDYELRVLFEQYGDLRALHTSDKNRGFIMVSYYNISAAQNAVRALHGRLLKGRKLDIHYFFPNNSVGSPVNSFAERHQSFNLPPSARIISSSRPVGLQESRNPFEVIKTGIQSMPNLHPHSFPDYLDNFASGSPFKSSTTFSEMVSNGQKANEGFMMGNVRGVGVDGFNRGVIGSPINQGSHGANLSLWSNANTQQHNPSSGMMWPNSPSRGNIPSQRIPSVNAFSRASTVMANMASSPVHHHIGSAPTLNSPFWNRRHACVAESPESSRFHLGSHVSMGYPGSSPSHHMEIGSHKVFSHVGGNRTDANSKNVVLQSPRQVPHLFPGRSSMLSVSGSFGMPNERYRNLSHRRSESNSSNGENKLYELDVDRILHGEDIRTTLMIKNIPNKYTSKMLLAAIDEYCKGTYDFLYLPIDFKNKCNVGYAFINLTEPKNIVPLYKAFNGKKWEKFNSEKVASLAYGRIQGKSALIAHFQNSSLMNEDKRCRPILFHTAGPNAGDQEPFPVGSNIRSRPGKPRTSSSTENYTNLSNSYENREELPIGIDSI